MARRGGQVDLASLVDSVGAKSAVDRGRVVDGQFRADVPVAELVANPRNPRDSVGDLEQLASIRETQLQPATVVSRDAYLELFPDDEGLLGQAGWVVINGCRRLAASIHFGRPGLDVVVRDALAESRDTLLWAAISENLDRTDFDVIEEAKAVAQLVDQMGGVNKAARRLDRSPTWVSQRRVLLDLHPSLQEKLRAGDLAIRSARELARVPQEEQVLEWQRAQDESATSDGDDGEEVAPEEGGTPAPQSGKPEPTPEKAARALKRLGATPDTLAAALLEVFDSDDLAALVQQLASGVSRK
ncbi:ParB N-terminal domain-containing protein [Gordonia alkaliphila]|uniref:ParB/RepB/Spo0J family partition protein n=1 Tax=Gordonia alkaliphila TaxID=1053547 RepID=UPI001FF1B876|nr:ParB N-terminal domain-containing protein [Gordonia alkaliphila]MCK0441153.1 ParB N-terminal domain-containing protein [Gordonia alkaliphila]